MFCIMGVSVIRSPGPRASYPVLDPRSLAPQNFSTSSTSSYLRSSHYDHGLWVYGLFKPCWLTHATCTCFKETALLLNVYLSCLVSFILCPTDKYMFQVNLVSSLYCQTTSSEKSYLLFDTYVLFGKWSLKCYSHVKILCFPIFCGKKCLLDEMVWKGVEEGGTFPKHFFLHHENENLFKSLKQWNNLVGI